MAKKKRRIAFARSCILASASALPTSCVAGADTEPAGALEH
jgi:hypothetical protein